METTLLQKRKPGKNFITNTEVPPNVYHARHLNSQRKNEEEIYFYDKQLIPWKKSSKNARNHHRFLKNMTHVMFRCRNDLTLDLVRPKKILPQCQEYYSHEEFFKGMPVAIPHFQLRNNLHPISEHNVYFLGNGGLLNLNTITGECKQIPGIPVQEYIALDISKAFAVLGEYDGKIVVYDLDRNVLIYNEMTGHETNHVEIVSNLAGPEKLLVAHNDCFVRLFDFNDLTKKSFEFKLSDPVNVSTMSPDQKLIATFGDKINADVIDITSSKIATVLKGHKDYGFSLAWHPKGNLLATTNQDGTCRIWDIRNPSKATEVLQGMIGNTNCVKFSGDGEYMAFCENYDYVHIYSVSENFCCDQVIDVFGEVNGVGFEPNEDGRTLYFGVNHVKNPGIFKYSRCKDKSSKGIQLDTTLI